MALSMLIIGLELIQNSRVVDGISVAAALSQVRANCCFVKVLVLRTAL